MSDLASMLSSAKEAGYQEGRRDMEKELEHLPNRYSEGLWQEAFSRGMKQGRQDAIEEAINNFINMSTAQFFRWLESQKGAES